MDPHVDDLSSVSTPLTAKAGVGIILPPLFFLHLLPVGFELTHITMRVINDTRIYDVDTDRNLLWKVKVPPRFKVFYWRLCKGWLAVKDKNKMMVSEFECILLGLSWLVHERDDLASSCGLLFFKGKLGGGWFVG